MPTTGRRCGSRTRATGCVAEADCAALGLLKRHREHPAEYEAAQAFCELFGQPSTEDELSARRSLWVRMPMSELLGALTGDRCNELRGAV